MGETVQAEEIGSSFVPLRRNSVESIKIDGEGLVFDEAEGSWHYLNPVAQIVWQCCDGTGSIEEIANDISEVFGEDPAVVLESVTSVVRSLGQQGLLEDVEVGEAEHPHRHTHDHDAEGPGHEPRFLPVPPSS